MTSRSSPHPIGMCRTPLLVLSSSTQCRGWALSPFGECAAVRISSCSTYRAHKIVMAGDSRVVPSLVLLWEGGNNILP